MVRGASRPVWVDRATELGLLESSLEQVRAGQPRAVLVMGETGVGKTALVAEFARRSGVRCFVGRCFKFGGGTVPYLPLVEVLRSFSREAEPADVLRVLGPARSDLARLLPELAPRSGQESPRAAREGTNLERARLFERLFGVAERLGADQPTIVVIEDAHWIDDSTRDTLVFLLHSVRQAQLMLVITCRSEELPPGHPFLTITAELERAGLLERIDLGRLGPADVEDQIAQIVGAAPDPNVVARIVKRSGGNPLFVEELLKVGGGNATAVPTGLRDILLGRVAALSPQSRALVRFAAIAGQSVGEPVLAATGLSDVALATALREAADEQLLVPSEKTDVATYEFRHPLLQEVVYDDQLPVERARAHAAIAQILSDKESSAPDTTAELAYHWYAAHEFGRALPAAIKAGIAAYLAYAFAEAYRQFDRALELWEKVPFPDDRVGIDHVALLEYASESATRLGDYVRGIELGKQSLAEIDASHDPERAATAHSRMRWVLWESGDSEQALADAQEAARLVPAEPPSALRANVLGHLAALVMFGGDLQRALALATEAADVAKQVGPSALAEEGLAVGIIGLAQVHIGQVEEGLAKVREALALAERLDHVTGIAVAYSQYAGVLDELGRAEETLAVARQGIAVAQKLGLERTFGALLRGSAAHALYELGGWTEADALVGSGLPTGGMSHEQTAALTGALIATGRGRFERAAVTIAALPTQPRPQTDPQLARLRLLADVELRLAQGNAREAQALLENAPELQRPAGTSALQGELLMLAIRAEADLAEAAATTNDESAATDARSRARKMLRRFPTASADSLAAAQRSTAEAEAQRATGHSKPEGWATAAAAWETAKRPYRLAYCSFRQAEAILREGGTREQAEPCLRTAHASCTSLEAAPLRGDVERLAHRLRISLAGRAPLEKAAANELTQREREVLTLLAAGRTNREIGDALFISPKTASVHVSNIFAKLGVERRVEAVGVARQLGLLTADHRPR